MEKVSKKYVDLLALIPALNEAIGKEEKKTKPQMKLQKFAEKIKPYLDKMQEDLKEEIEDLRLDYASCDSDGNVIHGEKGEYRYTKEKQKELMKKIKAVYEKFDSAEFEYTMIESVNPEGLDEFTFLKGWVNGVKFKKEEEKEEIEL